MIAALIIIILASITTIGIVGWQSVPKGFGDDSGIHLSTLLFSFWLISGAIFGPLFFKFKPPGLFDLTIERILFFFLLITMIIGLFSGRIDLRQGRSIEFWMFVFILICIVSMMRTGFVSTDPERYPNPWFVFITGYLFPFLVFIFSKHYLTGESDQMFVYHVLFYFGTYLVLIAPFEFFQMRQFVFPEYINDPKAFLHFERARGPFMNSALNGVAIITGFVSGVHLFNQKEGLKRFFYFPVLLLYFPAIFFTQTRSVYLAFLIVIAGLLFLYRADFPKWKLLALPVAIALVLMASQIPRLLSQDRRAGGVMQTKEIEIRLQLIQRSFDILKDHPFFGIGLAQFLPATVREYTGRGSVARSADEQTQHFHLLGLAVEIGIVGIFSYLSIYVLIFRRFFQLKRILPPTGFIGENLQVIGILIWAAYLCNNLFVEPSYFIFINSVPFMVGGIADGLYKKYILTDNLLS